MEKDVKNFVFIKSRSTCTSMVQMVWFVSNVFVTAHSHRQRKGEEIFSPWIPKLDLERDFDCFVLSPFLAPLSLECNLFLIFFIHLNLLLELLSS